MFFYRLSNDHPEKDQSTTGQKTERREEVFCWLLIQYGEEFIKKLES